LTHYGILSHVQLSSKTL